MYDIQLIRDDPKGFDAALDKRGEAPKSAEILALDEQSRAKTTELQELQTAKNNMAKRIGQAKAAGDDATDLFKDAEEIKRKMPEIEAELQKIQAKLYNILVSNPNIVAADVPEGKDEDDNIELRRVGEVKDLGFTPKDHHDLGEDLGLIDFKQTAKISGARFATLRGNLAKMERALGAFMLDIHTKKYDYTEMSPPALVHDSAMFGVGQLPKFAEDSFETTDGRRLVPTAEVTLTNMCADTIIPEVELPKRYVALSPCFRSEAGSAGRDTKGLIRMHQFSKVELVSVTRPEESEAEHERMTQAAEEVLKRLKLPYRAVLLCSGDIGFSAQKTYDLEVWLPSQQQYREISSCSNCGDFQARRMKARYKQLNSKKNQFVHTLNGSGLAIGRTIVAIMENYQNADGTITVPDALLPYMDGVTTLGREKF